MADDETNAVIVLDNGKPLKVQTTVSQISSEIEGQKNLALPVIKVVNEDGREVWINANHIIAFQEYESDAMPLLRFA
jgi:uncharacterized protein YlzI (FlbEa/FlbD family)